MIRTTNTKPSGLNRQALRTWGMLFLAAGIAGRSILQNAVLGLQDMSGGQLLQAMEENPAIMGFATLALVFQAVEACAVPIFAFLLVEGFHNTKDWKQYALRVAAVAVLSEIPYNLVTNGTWIAADSRNPAFALVLCMAALYFYRRYSGKKALNYIIKGVVFVSAVLWAQMLSIEHGGCCVIVVSTLWAAWKKQNLRTYMGCMAMMLCSLLSPFYLAAPMSFLAVHFYNGEKGEENKVVNYLAYPAVLLVFGLAGRFMM